MRRTAPLIRLLCCLRRDEPQGTERAQLGAMVAIRLGSIEKKHAYAMVACQPKAQLTQALRQDYLLHKVSHYTPRGWAKTGSVPT
ncbi:hypothetical protein PISMIDRAFT_672039 [Pisolithus microcarpus 441]|uniref:Uncharacterized protein n=1 Tax=Pisolithus microcarpus 441 TaxID=765257 RepID=A0A0C9ZTV2_9AGAM|nr:hypothetical protein PISMIDRAFT_672039 [Pisolithus microcarpus 441]